MDTIILGGDVDSTPIKSLLQTQPFIEGYLLAIEKLQEDAKKEAMGDGLLLVQQLQVMMTNVLTSLK